MNPLLAFLAPFGMLAAGPQGAAVPVLPQQTEQAAGLTERSASQDQEEQSDGLRAVLPRAWWPFLSLQRTEPVGQVRIEQRVIVRISPRLPPSRGNLSAAFPLRDVPTRFDQRPMPDCLELSSIGGVRAASDRLLLFLRDRRLVSATLEKGCSPSDYYSGFYLERNEDGRLCVGRDQLLARTGAKCEVSRLTQLVRAGD